MIKHELGQSETGGVPLGHPDHRPPPQHPESEPEPGYTADGNAGA